MSHSTDEQMQNYSFLHATSIPGYGRSNKRTADLPLPKMTGRVGWRKGRSPWPSIVSKTYGKRYRLDIFYHIINSLSLSLSLFHFTLTRSKLTNCLKQQILTPITLSLSLFFTISPSLTHIYKYIYLIVYTHFLLPVSVSLSPEYFSFLIQENTQNW